MDENAGRFGLSEKTIQAGRTRVLLAGFVFLPIVGYLFAFHSPDGSWDSATCTKVFVLVLAFGGAATAVGAAAGNRMLKKVAVRVGESELTHDAYGKTRRVFWTAIERVIVHYNPDQSISKIVLTRAGPQLVLLGFERGEELLAAIRTHVDCEPDVHLRKVDSNSTVMSVVIMVPVAVGYMGLRYGGVSLEAMNVVALVIAAVVLINWKANG